LESGMYVVSGITDETGRALYPRARWKLA